MSADWKDDFEVVVSCECLCGCEETWTEAFSEHDKDGQEICLLCRPPVDKCVGQRR